MKDEEKKTGKVNLSAIHIYDNEGESSDTSQDQTIECYCGTRMNVRSVNLKLNTRNKSILYVKKAPMFTVKGGKVKIYHAIWPEMERCVAIKFIIKSNSDTMDAAKKEIDVFEHFYKVHRNGKFRIIDYFGQ
ncbi:unnamed protein product [Meloidogyne enterolobii]|uniref:Uncharacterized protein n=1 Tax=Meloidogyne enterolobii TaxID=390850 RepID=A0ACB0ZQD9_MELEN